MSKNTFKVGDVVTCIKINNAPQGCQQSQLSRGQNYKVLAAETQADLIKLVGVQGVFHSSRFKLIGDIT